MLLTLFTTENWNATYFSFQTRLSSSIKCVIELHITCYKCLHIVCLHIVLCQRRRDQLPNHIFFLRLKVAQSAEVFAMLKDISVKHDDMLF